jgi:hypothetical protein
MVRENLVLSAAARDVCQFRVFMVDFYVKLPTPAPRKLLVSHSRICGIAGAYIGTDDTDVIDGRRKGSRLTPRIRVLPAAHDVLNLYK